MNTHPAIGTEGNYIVDGRKAGRMVVRVKIVNAKKRFGRTDYQIEPVTGSGSFWTPNVELDSVELNACNPPVTA